MVDIRSGSGTVRTGCASLRIGGPVGVRRRRGIVGMGYDWRREGEQRDEGETMYD